MSSIYVVCVASRAQGIEHGVDIEIDASTIPDDIQSAVDAMLGESPAPDASTWAVTDWDDFPTLPEQPDFDFLCRYAEAYEEHGEAFALWYENSPDGECSVDSFEDAYQGEYDSTEAYVEYFLDDTGMLRDLPKSLQRYFDYEACAHDLERAGDIWTAEASNGNVYVYRS